MKRIAWWQMILILALVCASGGTAVAEGAPNGLPQFPWKGLTWVVSDIRVNPDHITGNESPDTDQYLMVQLKCVDGSIPIADVVQNIALFSLVDGAGTAHPAKAYMPCTIQYNDRNGVFMTAADQTCFDLFFIVPAHEPATAFTFTIDKNAACSFSEAAMASVIR